MALALVLGLSCCSAARLFSHAQTVKADAAAAGRKVQPAFSVVERDANSRVLQKTTTEGGTNRIHQYTELASGMHYRDAHGQWVESKEEIEAFPDGAVARQGPYQVIFANNLNTAGVIDLQLPHGQRLRSHILGLSYFDTA